MTEPMYGTDVPAEADFEAAKVEAAAAVDAEIGLEGALDELALVDRGAPPQLLHGLPSSLHSPAAGDVARVLLAAEGFGFVSSRPRSARCRERILGRVESP
jgi:hypothetical protein